jgi:hypothetical protein
MHFKEVLWTKLDNTPGKSTHSPGAIQLFNKFFKGFTKRIGFKHMVIIAGLVKKNSCKVELVS